MERERELENVREGRDEVVGVDVRAELFLAHALLPAGDIPKRADDEPESDEEHRRGNGAEQGACESMRGYERVENLSREKRRCGVRRRVEQAEYADHGEHPSVRGEVLLENRDTPPYVDLLRCLGHRHKIPL